MDAQTAAFGEHQQFGVEEPAGVLDVRQQFGGDVGAVVGYACPIGSTPWFAEVIGGFQNLNGGTNGFSLSGPAHVEERVGFQTPLLSFISLPSIGLNLPQPGSLPVLPPGASLAGSPQNYIYGAFNQDDISASIGLATSKAWLFSPEIGTGFLNAIKTASGQIVVADVWAGVELQSNSTCLGATSICPKLGNRFKTGVSFKY